MARVKHVVLMRFRSDLAAQKIDETMSLLAALKDKIPGILEFSGGADVSREGLEKGFTRGFVMTFADEAARDAYLAHPTHVAVKEKVVAALEGGVDGVIIVDWLD